MMSTDAPISACDRVSSTVEGLVYNVSRYRPFCDIS